MQSCDFRAISLLLLPRWSGRQSTSARRRASRDVLELSPLRVELGDLIRQSLDVVIPSAVQTVKNNFASSSRFKSQALISVATWRQTWTNAI
jgi:hypothetical protein